MECRNLQGLLQKPVVWRDDEQPPGNALRSPQSSHCQSWKELSWRDSRDCCVELTGRSQPLEGAALEGLRKEDRSTLAEERQAVWTPTGVAIFNVKHPEPARHLGICTGICTLCKVIKH